MQILSKNTKNWNRENYYRLFHLRQQLYVSHLYCVNNSGITVLQNVSCLYTVSFIDWRNMAASGRLICFFWSSACGFIYLVMELHLTNRSVLNIKCIILSVFCIWNLVSHLKWKTYERVWENDAAIINECSRDEVQETGDRIV